MRYNPITPEQANEGGGDFELLPAGRYKMRVVEAVEKTSKKGNPMLEIVLECQHPHHDYTRRVWDYLLGTEEAAWKLRHFADAAGLTDQYETGELSPNDALGCIVEAEIKVVPAKDDYPAKNSVKDYLPREAATLGTPARREKPPHSQGTYLDPNSSEKPPWIDDDEPNF